jgi:TIR domain/SIR2-like domain
MDEPLGVGDHLTKQPQREGMSELDDYLDDLVEFVRDRRVIPVIGPELLQVGPKPDDTLTRWVAQKLAAKLGLPGGEAGGPLPSLNSVVYNHLARGGQREDIYPKINAVMRDAAFTPPAPLLKLAAIRQFRIFVTLTFDNLLKTAIDTVRLGGTPGTDTYFYSPKAMVDLPRGAKGVIKPSVFHLLGKLSPNADYVITEEDAVEFVYTLQSEYRRPERLFDELRSSHLLLIGCALPDWLTRFFIRVMKNSTLSDRRNEKEILVDYGLDKNNGLILFLKHFSYSTRVVPCSPVEFVDRLWERMDKPSLVPSVEPDPEPVVPETAAPLDTDISPGAVFISYASENARAAMRLREELETGGANNRVEVWLDKRAGTRPTHADGLKPGEYYEKKIQRSIGVCSCFIPILSRQAAGRPEGFFRREWDWAVDRARGIAAEVPFILPVAIDDVPYHAQGIHDWFNKLHWTRYQEGASIGPLKQQLVQLQRHYHMRLRA